MNAVPVTALPVLALAAVGVVLVAAVARSPTPLPAERRLTTRASPVSDRAGPFGPVVAAVVSVLTRRRRRPPGPDETASWCESLARRLRAGDSLTTAICTAEASPIVTSALAPTRLGVERGTSVADALGASRGASAALDDALSVVSACAVVGGPAAAALDRTASALRDRSAIAAERRAQSAQARLSATVLTLLPIGALCLLLLTSASTRAVMVGPVGMICVPAGAVLELAGWWWIRMLVRGAA